MERNDKKTHKIALSVLIFVLTVVVTVVAGYLKKWNNTELISNTVFVMMGTCVVLFLHAFSYEHKLYDYDNEVHFTRFVLLWVLSLAFAVTCSFIPVDGWPFLVVYLCFTLFGNMAIGIASGSVILLLTVLLTGEGISAFLLYFLCGIICVSLFYKLDQNYKIGVPLVVSILCLILGLTAGVVLYANEKLSLELFMIPFINVFVSIILMIGVLKLFSTIYIYRYRVKYLEINDPEFPLQANWKQTNRKKYYQAMHTAYFCDRIANRLGLDAEAAKAAGYYQHIGSLKGSEGWEDTKSVCEEYDFPPAVRQILREALDKQWEVTLKETAVLILSDGVISAILYLIEKQPDTKPDYDQIVDTVFKNKLKSGIFSKCKITLEEICVMEKIFKEEKLYYDFLR